MSRLSWPERRSQIVEGACAIILEKGLAGTATRDVTRHLGVGSGLLHHYFKTWGELRAEVVKTFIHQEITALRQTLSDCPTDRAFERFIDWMTADPDLRFWRLWLDAIEEARRDPDLAAIVQDGHVQWHAAIVEMLDRSIGAKAVGSVNSQHAAWRISAIFDGLMGIMTIGHAPMTKELVTELVSEQIDMELRRERSDAS
jgi:AcrR family transcriptional regulator